MKGREHPYAKHLLDLRRPQQYIGGEWNLPPATAEGPRVTLVYPDIYELGMSNFGLSILRHVLVRSNRFDVRRAFSPAPDLDEIMDLHGVPWVDLEGWDPVAESRVVGFTVSSEALYTNVLHLISRMGLPLRSSRRGEDSPMIIMGGGGLANPLPLSPFADLFFLGEVEQDAVDLFEVLAGSGSRAERLRAASGMPGVYVPGITSGKVEFRRVPVLDVEDAPVDQLVPISKVSQDRAVVEIARGCTRGCRFCQASQLYRPVRQRTSSEILDLVHRSLASTGWEKAGLLTLSLSDHTELRSLICGMKQITAMHHATSSMPSLRPDSILRMGDLCDVEGRVTLAPEAGTESLRERMNKPISDETILEAVDMVFRMGARGVKLYFMVGLPRESDDDLKGIAELVRRISRICRHHGRNPYKSVSVSLSPFVPKAQTPLQWASQMHEDEIWRRIELVRRSCGKRVNLGWNSPRVAVIEALLSLGDDGSTADMLEQAVLRGARFDAWTDLFRWDIWKDLMEEYPAVLERIRSSRDPHEPLPWDFISTGVDREFLRREYSRYLDNVSTPDCRSSGCHECGACDGTPVVGFEGSGLTGEEGEKGIRKDVTKGKRGIVLRVRYSKTGIWAFTSHLDMVRMWGRVLRRSDLPVSWSDGYVSRPRVQFGPPLPLGIESEGEYLDVRLDSEPVGEIANLLRRNMSGGFRVLETWILDPDVQPPDTSPVAAEYEVSFQVGEEGMLEAEGLAEVMSVESGIIRAETVNDVDVRFLAPADDKKFRPDRIMERMSCSPVSLKKIETYFDLAGIGWRSLGSHSRELEKMFIES